ncbi:MAG: hypothetical protein L0229_15140, partial [Blastocatellia bacterium]|nr:hypothetical protein [Blastocatellia bacterium]
ATFLDVREADEFEQGTIPGSVFIPRGNLEGSVEGKLPDKSAPVVVYCAGGTRSAFAAKTLAELGYSDVVSMAGGFNQWKNEGRNWATPQSLSAEQRNRAILLGLMTAAGWDFYRNEWWHYQLFDARRYPLYSDSAPLLNEPVNAYKINSLDKCLEIQFSSSYTVKASP